MREIKFRAWDEINKIMHYNFQFVKSGDEGNDWIIFISDKQPINYSWDKNPYFSQQLKITQSTGLLDKNGKEIYEGDIIEMTDPYGENKAQTEIKYNNGAFTVEADGWFGMGECDVTSVGWAQEEDVSMEVIGNIYENPDLC